MRRRWIPEWTGPPCTLPPPPPSNVEANFWSETGPRKQLAAPCVGTIWTALLSARAMQHTYREASLAVAPPAIRFARCFVSTAHGQLPPLLHLTHTPHTHAHSQAQHTRAHTSTTSVRSAMTSLPKSNGRRSGSSSSSLIPELTRPTARRPPSLAAPQLSVADASIDNELAAALRRADLHGSTSTNGSGGDKTPSTLHAVQVSYDDAAAADAQDDEVMTNADTLTEGEEGSQSDADDLSTTSGRRHGALLQPEMEDWLILEVSGGRVVCVGRGGH